MRKIIEAVEIDGRRFGSVCEIDDKALAHAIQASEARHRPEDAEPLSITCSGHAVRIYYTGEHVGKARNKMRSETVRTPRPNVEQVEDKNAKDASHRALTLAQECLREVREVRKTLEGILVDIGKEKDRRELLVKELRSLQVSHLKALAEIKRAGDAEFNLQKTVQELLYNTKPKRRG